MNEIVCEMLRLSEAAKRLSVSPNKLRAMADRGEVPYVNSKGEENGN